MSDICKKPFYIQVLCDLIVFRDSSLRTLFNREMGLLEKYNFSTVNGTDDKVRQHNRDLDWGMVF